MALMPARALIPVGSAVLDSGVNGGEKAGSCRSATVFALSYISSLLREGGVIGGTGMMRG